jgi:hypothetical protein
VRPASRPLVLLFHDDEQPMAPFVVEIKFHHGGSFGRSLSFGASTVPRYSLAPSFLANDHQQQPQALRNADHAETAGYEYGHRRVVS